CEGDCWTVFEAERDRRRVEVQPFRELAHRNRVFRVFLHSVWLSGRLFGTDGGAGAPDAIDQHGIGKRRYSALVAFQRGDNRVDRARSEKRAVLKYSAYRSVRSGHVDGDQPDLVGNVPAILVKQV